MQPTRWIVPYWVFPEFHHDTLTLNEYGYSIADGFKGPTLTYRPEAGSGEFIDGIFDGSMATAFYRDGVARLTLTLAEHSDLAGRDVTVLNRISSPSASWAPTTRPWPKASRHGPGTGALSASGSL